MGRANSQAGKVKTAGQFFRRWALILRPIGRASGSAAVSVGFSMSNLPIKTADGGFTGVKLLFYA